MRLVADAVGGLPGHGELVGQGSALDDPHEEVVVLDAAAAHCEVELPPEVELVADRDALPVVHPLLKNTPPLLLLHTVTSQQRIAAAYFDLRHFLLTIFGEGGGQSCPLTSLAGPATSHYILTINPAPFSLSFPFPFLSSPPSSPLIVIVMNNSQELVLSLQEYIVELQTENRSLKQHVFHLQERAQGTSSAFHDDIEKLKVYIDHCQNEISKRENREVTLLELLSEMETAKGELEVAREEACRERDIYIQQIEELSKELKERQDDISKLQRQEEALKHSLSPQNRNSQNLPPKSGKCKNCETYIKNQQILQQHIAQRQQMIASLQGDILCLRQFI